MSIVEPAKIITPWADTGSKNPIPQNSNNTTGEAGYDKGFPDITMTPPEAGGIPPAGQDFNGIFYEVTNILRYMQAGGQPTFDAALATAIGGYPKGAMILGNDGVTLWQSKVDSNSTDPNTDPSDWGAFDIGLKADLAAPDGSDIVGFQQAGVGSVPRTAQDKMREIVSIKDFGVIGDGVIDDTSSFTAAVAYANSAGVKLVSPSGLRVKLTGAPVIEIKTSLDMNGSALNLEQFRGMITFKRSIPEVTYVPGSAVVTALQSQATLTGVNFTGWLNTAEVENAFVKINSTQPWFMYRGGIVNRTEYNKMTRYGIAESELRYPLTSSLVTSVTVRPIEKVKRVAENIVFDLGSNDLANGIITIETSLFEAKNWKFNQNNFSNATKNQTLVSVINSCHIKLTDIYFNWPCRSDAESTYNLYMGECYDVVVDNMHGIGDGWGATGANLCQRVEFKNCALSRIDFHKPFIEYLKITNCKIGNWGVLVTALGDMLIDGCEFLRSAMPYVNNGGYIRSREDTGGFCDGNLTINNSVFRDAETFSLRTLVVHQGDPAQVKPSGSTINYRFWKTITIDNISSKNNLLNLMPSVKSLMPYTSNINIVNCINENGGLIAVTDLSSVTPFRVLSTAQNSVTDNRANLIINVANTSLRKFSITETGATDFAVNANLTNVSVTEYQENNMEFEVTASGVYTLLGCAIEGFDFFSGASADRPISVIFDSGVIRHTGVYTSSLVSSMDTTKVRLSVSKSEVKTTSVGSLNTLLPASLSGNTYKIEGGAESGRIVCSSDLQSGTGALVVANVNTANNYILQTGYTGDGSVKDHRIVMPDPGFSFYVPVSSTSGVSVKRETNGTSLTVTSAGGVVARTVQLT